MAGKKGEGNKGDFWKRYETDNKLMSIEEIREGFLGDQVLMRLDRIERSIDSIRQVPEEVGQQKTRATLFGAPPSVNLITDGKVLVGKVDDIFRKTVGDSRYLRLSITPDNLRPDLFAQDNPDFLKIFENPPGQRDRGWSVVPVTAPKSGPHGFRTKNVEYHHLWLLRNGHIEFWTQVDESFCWMQNPEQYKKHPRLYPIAVCEYPVSFLRFAKSLYEAVGLSGGMTWRMQYWHLDSCILLPGAHNQHRFMMPLEPPEPYPEHQFRHEERLARGFHPDKSALVMIEAFYRGFRYSRKDVPYFDDEGNFVLSEYLERSRS
jgi:hypothetical protein